MSGYLYPLLGVTLNGLTLSRRRSTAPACFLVQEMELSCGADGYLAPTNPLRFEQSFCYPFTYFLPVTC